MKESLIRHKAIEILEEDGYRVWYPPKVKWIKEGDIWGVYDLMAVKEKQLKWIQLTTLTNIRAREKKILKFLLDSGADLHSEVWGWSKKHKRFKILPIKI